MQTVDWRKFKFSNPLIVQVSENTADELKMEDSPILIQFFAHAEPEEIQKLYNRIKILEKYNDTNISSNAHRLRDIRVNIIVNRLENIHALVRTYDRTSDKFYLVLAKAEEKVLWELLNDVCLKKMSKTLHTFLDNAIQESESNR